LDSKYAYHGFLRTPDGIITEFDVAGASTKGGLGTLAMTINPQDAITGYYFDTNGTAHGFVRMPW
jgi:hypothetical protein